eukprot:COSAG06_NODE_28936_length_565_cov_0.952790_1_plen_48_part_10
MSAQVVVRQDLRWFRVSRKVEGSRREHMQRIEILYCWRTTSLHFCSRY